MDNKVLLAVILKTVEDRIHREFESQARSYRIPARGRDGFDGADGKDGVDGKDGKDFSFSEHEETLRAWIKESALKFSDLTEAEIEKLKGSEGKPGKDFNFSEHQTQIQEILNSYISNIQEDLKLKFSDLTDEEKLSLKGPRGQRGKQGDSGKDFNFEEHREFFEGLKPKFSDFTEEEVNSLKLKFSDLSEEEKDSLKLKFEELTEEDRFLLRGPRGQKGKQGLQGERGEKGEKGDRGERGIQGIPGLQGLRGIQGVQGLQGEKGKDGKDAPIVVDIITKKTDSGFKLTFIYSDGTSIETDNISLEGLGQQLALVFGPSGSSGGATTEDSNLLQDVDCDEEVYVGSAVYLSSVAAASISDISWSSLSIVYSMAGDNYTTLAKLALADNYNTSMCVGIVESKPTTTTCNIRMAGKAGGLFFGLPLGEDFYLSDVDAGKLVIKDDAPTAVGSVRVRLGTSLSHDSFKVNIGERIEIV